MEPNSSVISSKSIGREDDVTTEKAISHEPQILDEKVLQPVTQPADLLDQYQRGEHPNSTAPSHLEIGDWVAGDRVTSAARWQQACIYNLINLRPNVYTQPHERRDFYLWFYNHTSALGFETRWPLAAYLVGSGAARLSYGSVFSNDVQIAARLGNQVIFDDVFPKLRDLLVQGKPLTGTAAQAWDAQTLSEEQQLVQSMYLSLSSETIEEFAGYAQQKSWPAALARRVGLIIPHRYGQYHRITEIPEFTGDIMNIEDRFRYGMILADQFSTHPAPSPSPSRPAPAEKYVTGEMFDNLNVRLELHQLDAELDDINVDEERVVKIMQSLSVNEQRELGYNRLRLEQFKNALNKKEMERGLRSLTEIPEAIRKFLLQ